MPLPRPLPTRRGYRLIAIGLWPDSGRVRYVQWEKAPDRQERADTTPDEPPRRRRGLLATERQGSLL